MVKYIILGSFLVAGLVVFFAPKARPQEGAEETELIRALFGSGCKTCG